MLRKCFRHWLFSVTCKEAVNNCFSTVNKNFTQSLRHAKPMRGLQTRGHGHFWDHDEQTYVLLSKTKSIEPVLLHSDLNKIMTLVSKSQEWKFNSNILEISIEWHRAKGTWSVKAERVWEANSTCRKETVIGSAVYSQ